MRLVLVEYVTGDKESNSGGLPPSFASNEDGG